MMRKILSAFLIVLLVFLFFSCQKEKVNNKEAFKSILLSADGKPIPLPKNKLIFVNFLAYSCTSCMKEMPIIKKVLSEPKYKNKFQFIGIVIDSNEGDFSDPNFPIYPGDKRNFVRFPVRGTPTTYIITPKGKKLLVIFGAVTEENLRKFLDQAIQKAESLKKES